MRAMASHVEGEKEEEIGTEARVTRDKRLDTKLKHLEKEERYCNSLRYIATAFQPSLGDRSYTDTPSEFHHQRLHRCS